MANKPIKICVLLKPSIRGIAYMCAFRELGIYPEEIILMPGDIGGFEDLRVENNKFDYSRHFFDLSMNLSGYVRECGANVNIVSSTDVNSPEIRNVLKSCDSRYIIFTGGGILKKDVLSVGKDFVHIHPGIVPEFRGSTCFYYSIIEQGKVGSTAFIMDEHIDTGQTIACSEFRINYKVLPEQALFMDYILDPYIRAYTLKKVLSLYVSSGTLYSQSQIILDKPTYFVMHPLLRHVAIERINKMYNENFEARIFEITGGR